MTSSVASPDEDRDGEHLTGSNLTSEDEDRVPVAINYDVNGAEPGAQFSFKRLLMFSGEQRPSAPALL